MSLLVVLSLEGPGDILYGVGFAVFLFGGRFLLGGADQFELFVSDLLPEFLVLCMQSLILALETDKHLPGLFEQGLPRFFGFVELLLQ